MMTKSIRLRLPLLLASLLAAVMLSSCSNGGSASTSGAAFPANTSSAPSAQEPSAAPAPAGGEQPDSSPVSSESPAPASPVPNPLVGPVTAMRLADFDTGWTGGNGWIARTDDAGKSWTTQLKHDWTVQQLFALNKRQVWATLDKGDAKSIDLIASTDGGGHWENGGIVPNRAFLHFVSSKEAFSGNARTTDGGKSWTTYAVPAGTVGDPYFHDRDNGWAVSFADGKFSFQRTTDGAKHWKETYSRATEAPVTGTVIRSAGKNDAWIALIGDSGMSQTSYSLFHTSDGGKRWTPVLANNQAGSGPAPGFKMDEATVPRNNGSGPGTLNAGDPKTAFMGGVCNACDLGNSLGKTTDGGKSWINLKAQFPGHGPQFIGAEDAKRVWFIATDNTEPSALYTSKDGGETWTKAYTFAKP